MKPRRIRIDFKAVSKESGLKRGKLCRSPVFGWGVQNTSGDEGPDFGCITPPPFEEDENFIEIDGKDWVLSHQPAVKP